jgi:hypothetical protein
VERHGHGGAAVRLLRIEGVERRGGGSGVDEERQMERSWMR